MATNYKQCKHCAAELNLEHGPVSKCPVRLSKIPTTCTYCGSDEHTATLNGRGSQVTCPQLLDTKAKTKEFVEARAWYRLWGAACDDETISSQMQQMPALRSVLKQKGIPVPDEKLTAHLTGFDALPVDFTEAQNTDDELLVEGERLRKAEVMRLKATKVAPKKKLTQKEKRQLLTRDARVADFHQKMFERQKAKTITLLTQTFGTLLTATQQAKDDADTKAVEVRKAMNLRQYGLNRKQTKQLKRTRPATVDALNAVFRLAEMA